MKGAITIGLLCLAALASAEEPGAELYRQAGGYGCAVCHGPLADGGGQAGGYIRGATLEALNDSLQNNAPMMPLSTVLSDDQRQLIVGYLKTLGDRPLVVARFEETGMWQGSFEPIEPGESFDLLLYNATFNTVTVDLGLADLQPIEIEPLSNRSVTASTLEPLVERLGLTPKAP